MGEIPCSAQAVRIAQPTTMTEHCVDALNGL